MNVWADADKPSFVVAGRQYPATACWFLYESLFK